MAESPKPLERRRSLQKDYRFRAIFGQQGSNAENPSPSPSPTPDAGPSTHAKPALSLLHMIFNRVADAKAGPSDPSSRPQTAAAIVAAGACDECSKEPATLTCPLCAAVFCAACAKKVHASKVLSTHQVLPIKPKETPAQPVAASPGKKDANGGKDVVVSPSRQLPAVPRTTCPVHPDKLVEVCCKTCNKPACSLCATAISGSEHQGHQFEKLEEALDRTRTQVVGCLADIKQVVDTKIADVNFNLKMSSDMVREKFEQLKKELDVRCKVLLDDLQLKSRAEIDKLTEHAKALVGFQKRVDAVRDGTVASRVPVTNEELRMLHVLGGVDTVPLMEDAEVSQEQDKKDVDCALKIVLDSDVRCILTAELSDAISAYGSVKVESRVFGDFKFDRRHCGSSVEVAPDCLTATFTSDQGIFGDSPIPALKLSYWEVEVLETKTAEANVFVGIGKKDGTNLNMSVGATKGMSYRPATGDKWKDGVRSPYGTRGAKAGTIIGVKVDMRRGAHFVEFYHNGKSQGVAFIDVSGPDFYPLFGSHYSKLRLIVNPTIPPDTDSA